MDDHILDEIQPKKDARFYYKKSKKNLKLSALLIVLSIVFIFLLLSVTGFGAASIGFVLGIMSMLAYLVAGIISVIGITNGINSYRKKEPHSSGRFLTLIGNILVFGFVLLPLIANGLDIYRAFSGIIW